MMIIAVALLALVALQIRAAIAVTEARKLQQATSFGNEAMEEMHSIPWNTLNRGLYSGFLAAGGGDSLVSAGNLNVDGTTRQLIVAASPNDQSPSNLARPLVNKNGSNQQVLNDPSLTGVNFTVKAYVLVPTGGNLTGIVGMAVVVEWPGRNGTQHTTLWSQAYRGADSACGNADTQPFLAACQSYFEATASSGSVTVGISASDPASGLPESLMTPANGPEYTLSMRTASASAHLRSQQVNYVDGTLEYGGNTAADSDPSTPPVPSGYDVQTLQATDDITNQDGLLPNPPTFTFNQGSGADTEAFLSQPSSPIDLQTRSDYQRTGTVTASTLLSCLAGIPAGQPCAKSSIANDNATELTGSGYLLMNVHGTTFRMSRRLSNEAAGTTIGNTDSAWVARLASQPGSAAIGCTAVTGSGCVAAGAVRTNAVLSIGKVIDGNAKWGNDAVDGMVQVLGGTGCPYYTDSVGVQRGTSQTTAAPTVARCGQVRYWNGTGYTSVPITTAALPTYATAQVAWTDGTYSVTAVSTVQVLPSVITNPAPTDATCITAACSAKVSAGTIYIVSTYDITWSGHEHLLIVTTTVTGSGASASYKATPGG
jgi:hypothetical protein